MHNRVTRNEEIKKVTKQNTFEALQTRAIRIGTGVLVPEANTQANKIFLFAAIVILTHCKDNFHSFSVSLPLFGKYLLQFLFFSSFFNCQFYILK